MHTLSPDAPARQGRPARSRRSASAPGRSAAAAGRSAGARRTTPRRSARSATRSSRGVNWIDTAAVYGYGHSEEVVARALAEIPPSERPLVFTKCGLRWDDADRMASPVRDSSAAPHPPGVRGLAAPAAHGRDRPLPVPLAGRDRNAARGLVGRDAEAGATRARCAGSGVSNFDSALLDRCESLRPRAVAAAAVLDDPARRGREPSSPGARRTSTGVIVYSPMQSGLLTDTFTAERVGLAAPDDWRRQLARSTSRRTCRANLALRDALRPIAAKHGVSVAAIAVAWTLCWPITAAIVGARSPQQVDGWLPAAGLSARRERSGRDRDGHRARRSPAPARRSRPRPDPLQTLDRRRRRRREDPEAEAIRVGLGLRPDAPSGRVLIASGKGPEGPFEGRWRAADLHRHPPRRSPHADCPDQRGVPGPFPAVTSRGAAPGTGKMRSSASSVKGEVGAGFCIPSGRRHGILRRSRRW